MIDKTVTLQIIDEQIKQLQTEGKALIEKFGWNIEVKDMTVYVNMKSNKDNEQYLLRIQCEGYPEKDLTIQFVDETSRVPKSRAWPVDEPEGDKKVFLPERMIICLTPRKGDLWAIPEIIQRIQYYLDYSGYKGRYDPAHQEVKLEPYRVAKIGNNNTRTNPCY
jgi:hypothetical protein